MQQLRDTKNVFICTISSLNTQFFQKPLMKRGKEFSCAAWFADEASQCPNPAFIEGWIAMNLHHLIIGGDYNQLQAFAESAKGREVFLQSPIWYGQNLPKGFCVLLDVQSRMPAHLYQPTSEVFYNGLITTPDFCNKRPYETELAAKLSKLEINPDGGENWHSLGHSVVIFDLVNSQADHYGKTSWQNEIESNFVSTWIPALGQVGVPWSDIMALTPYEGQYQVLSRSMKNMGANGVAVRKIDSSQGAEFPIVVFSPVKTHQIGFMASSQRTNVATSRQKSTFFLIGRLQGLTEKDKKWAILRDAIYTANKGLGVYYVKVTHACKFRVAGTTNPVIIPSKPVPALRQPRARPKRSTQPDRPARPLAKTAGPLSSPENFMAYVNTSDASLFPALPTRSSKNWRSI